MIHQLKILPAYFMAVLDGRKTFEIRDNNDRGFNAGDRVDMREWDPSLGGSYTGRSVFCEITYVTGFNQQPGWVVFGIKVIQP